MTKDEEFLKKYLEEDTIGHPFQGVMAEIDTLPSLDDATLAKQEKQATADVIKAEGDIEKAKSDAAKAAARAEADRARKERDAIREQRQSERARRTENQQRVQDARTIAGQTKQLADKALQPAKDVADRIASFRTVGGIGLLLAILFILLFTVVQVNAEGDTRLKQFWYMLNGKAKLMGKKQLEVPNNPTNYGQEFQALASAETKTIADIGTAISQGVQGAVSTATGGNTDIAAGIIGGIASEFGLSFRSMP